jgi:hypothetical protein
LCRNEAFLFRLFWAKSKPMSMPEIDTPNQIETAIAEALTGIERQRQMIADFQARGYDVRAPLTLLACLLVNLRRLEDKRREDVAAKAVAV